VQISHPNFVFKLYIKKTLHTSTTCGLPFVSSARPSIITESALVLRKIAPQVGTSSSPSKTSFTERPMCLSAFLNQKTLRPKCPCCLPHRAQRSFLEKPLRKKVGTTTLRAGRLGARRSGCKP